jgi:hypothetical protein
MANIETQRHADHAGADGPRPVERRKQTGLRGQTRWLKTDLGSDKPTGTTESRMC